MRHLICGVLAGLLLAAPAFAQSAPANPAPKPPAAGPAPGAAPSAQASGKPADTKTQPAKDDSMANYDVNGSSASDAMGGSR